MMLIERLIAHDMGALVGGGVRIIRLNHAFESY
jgi:hypothetical protein